MESNYALSTIDNPFDPFNQFDYWFAFDCDHGYYSCSRLMRIAQIGDDLSEKEKDIEIERAIDEIIKFDPLGIYVKVKKELTEA